jgi:hypothetical protein
VKNSSLSVPEYKNYEYGYNLAYKLAAEQLAATGDLKQQCLKSGAGYKRAGSKEIITVEFLNQAYQVTVPDIDVALVGSPAEVPISDKILILHYLTLASGVPLSDRPIA